MKRLLCLLTVLAMLLPGAAALADPEEWEYHVTDDYTIRYPDYIQIYGVPEEETGWNMEVFEDPEDRITAGVPVMIIIFWAGADDWMEWLETGEFPDERGESEPMERVTVDEPPVDLNTGLETTYALFRSEDGTRMTEAFIFDPEEGDMDCILLCRFPSVENDFLYSDVFHWMIETLTFAGAEPGENPDGPSSARGSFYVTEDWEYDGYHAVIKDVDVDKTAESNYYVYVTSDVTKFKVEKLTWNDSTFKVQKAKTIYSAKKLTTENVVSLYDWIPEMLPNVRIRAVNQDGIEEVWYISVSGEDGSMLLFSEEEMAYDPD